jgi:hypothetical protein
MKKLALFTLAAAALFAIMAGAASAQYYSPGYGVPIEPRYDRDYDEQRYYRRDRDDYRNDRRYRTWNGCPPHYTVQDGVCKPYRGY